MLTLVLNASYEVLKIITWKRAAKLYFLDKVDIVESYDKKILTPNVDMYVPAVVKYKYLVKPKYKALKFSKLNVHHRDEFTCLYCGKKQARPKLTIDHVIPRSRGGETSWFNCASACKPCNTKKGNKTLKEANMALIKEPTRPNMTEAVVLAMRLNSMDVPDIWRNYAIAY